MSSTMGTVPSGQQDYYTQVLGELGSNNSATGLQAAEMAQAAPAAAGAGLQFAGYQAQMGLLGPEMQQQDAYQSQMAGFQLGQLGIQNQQTGLSQQGTTQSYQTTQQQNAITQQQEALGFHNSQENLQGSLAASGALNTHGSTQQQGTLAEQYQWQQQELQGQEALEAGNYDRAQQNYALIGKANGLSQQEVYSRLQNAYAQNADTAASSLDSLVAQAGGALSNVTQDVGGALANYGLLAGLNTHGILGG